MFNFNCVALHCVDLLPESQEPILFQLDLANFPISTVATLQFHRTFGKGRWGYGFTILRFW